MKKRLTILLAIALFMVLSQTVSAKSYVSGNLGVNLVSKWEDGNVNTQDTMFNYGIGLKYNFVNKFYLSASISRSSFIFSDIKDKISITDIQLFLKYDAFNLGLINVGIQIGGVHNVGRINGKNEAKHVSYLAAGIFANVNITQKIETYLEFKVPFAYIKNANGETASIDTIKHLIYDFIIGLRYELSEDIFLSVQGNVYKMTFDYVPDATNNLQFTRLLIFDTHLGYKF